MRRDDIRLAVRHGKMGAHRGRDRLRVLYRGIPLVDSSTCRDDG